jgi:hypothetical protein
MLKTLEEPPDYVKFILYDRSAEGAGDSCRAACSST